MNKRLTGAVLALDRALDAIAASSLPEGDPYTGTLRRVAEQYQISEDELDWAYVQFSVRCQPQPDYTACRRVKEASREMALA